MANLASIYRSLGKLEELEGLFMQAAETPKKVLGPTHSSTLYLIDTLVARKFRAMIKDQGFVNIREEPLKWPTGIWPNGDKEKNIGH